MPWLFGKKGEKEEKKEDKAPKLPEFPPIPEAKSKGLPPPPPVYPKSERPAALPSFPSSRPGEEISHKFVKQAIEEPHVEEETEKPISKEFQPSGMVRGLEEMKIRQEEFGKKKIPEIGRPLRKTGPVFVRIDKFQDALSDFQAIKTKLLEIENMLKDIKDIKAKEDAELQEWESEIQDAKAKLDRIDAKIFQKLEE